MKALILGINFFPELTGIGKYTGEMAGYLSEQGVDVTVITAPPYYPSWKIHPDYKNSYSKQTWKNIIVYRCPLFIPRHVNGFSRILHLMSFAISSLPHVIYQSFNKFDVIFTIEPTLLTAFFASIMFSKQRQKKWLHIQDFEIDAAFSLGILNHQFLNKLLLNWERRIYQKFDVISSISHKMTERAKEKAASNALISFFPNWIDVQAVYPKTISDIRINCQFKPSDIVLLYSGSIGQKQGFESLFGAMQYLVKNKNIHLVVCGEGAGKAELQRAASGNANIHFLPLQPTEQFNDLINLADIHVLPQKNMAADIVMPSKLLGILASGRPVIAECLEGSELYSIVSKVGVVTYPDDAYGFAQNVLKLATNPSLRSELGKLGREYAVSHYSKEAVLASFLSILRKVSID